MLLTFLLMSSTLWFVPFVLTAIGYIGVLRKMGLPWWPALIPAGAEYLLTSQLYPKMRTFWRPFLVASFLTICAYYLNPFEGTGAVVARIYLVIAVVVYEFFLLRLYYRLAKAFGKGLFFGLLTFLLPPLGLGILGFGKAAYDVTSKPAPPKPTSPVLRFLLGAAFTLISLAEAAAFVLAVGFLTVKTYPPRILGEYILSSTYDQYKDVTGTGTVITREDSMGEAVANLDSMPVSREKFYPDHSQDKSVVVMEYIIGSDLEDKMGLSTANTLQLIDATKKGDGMTIVMQTGGSRRWFTKGIADNSYGRYTIRNGKLEKALDLPSDTCMSEPKELLDFINWTKENYPADRYMLVMWDHGGGLSTGYGFDRLNRRTDSDYPLLSVTEIIQAIDQSGIKFDLIGFDACLMQDIEIAAALEPYADYYLASEEVEGGFGWCDTSGFGMLAENPGTPTEAFGKEMVASFDPYNTVVADGKEDTTSTLSLVDLPRAKAAYQQLEGFFADVRPVMTESTSSFANMSLAGTKSYTFQNSEQVDLIDFLTNLDKIDYDDTLCSKERVEELTNAVKACVVYRNGNSANGINGIALTFPVKNIDAYTDDYHQMTNLSLNTQKDLYNDFFSIIAIQKKKAQDSFDAENASLLETLNMALQKDYTAEEWYVEGFENFETQEAIIDIPLTEVENGYQIQLPDSAWDIIADSQIIAYQKTEDGLLRYLGHDNIGNYDENGHPLVAMEGSWVHVANRLVSYEATESRDTNEGTIFTGVVKARLNGSTDIKLYVEWDPVTEETTEPVKGRIIGYTAVESDIASMLSELINPEALETIASKGKEELQPGDRVDFLFDYYDEEGKLVKTEAYGRTMTVTSQENIEVDDEMMSSSDVVFGGVLTDVYQRTMTTEKIEAHVD